jgi:hypothetical protein
MAVVTQSDQVLFRVLARVAPELLVVNFQVRPFAADLASPAITLQDRPMEFGIPRAIYPDGSDLR